MKINQYNHNQIAVSIKDCQTGREWVNLFNSIGCKDIYDEFGLPDIGKANGQRPSKKEYLFRRFVDLDSTDDLRNLFESILNKFPDYRETIDNNIKDDGYQTYEQDGNIVIHGGARNRPARPVKTDAYFDNIASQIIGDLDGAIVSIHVAMAWFTNQSIADKLVEKFKQGIDVKVVYYDDHTNAKFGVDIDGIPFKAVKGTRGGKMHNKFCVIDNQKVITGSYNWSDNAENKNDENAVVIYEDQRASDYSVEFRRLFNE